MERLKDSYLNGHISKAEFEVETLWVTEELGRFQLSSKPEPNRLFLVLKDLPILWNNMNSIATGRSFG
jgi:hypothetical protein